MKLIASSSFQRAAFLAYLLRQSNAVKCGNWATKSCIGEVDKRYDPNYTNNLKEQNPIWGHYEGLWVATMFAYDEEGLPSEPSHHDPAALDGSPYTEFPFYTFINTTVVGSRVWRHWYVVLPPGSQSFCEEPIPDGFTNIRGNGTCGVNGFSEVFESFATSSHEKDGSAHTLPFSTSELEDIPRDDTGHSYVGVPIDNRTLYLASAFSKMILLSETFVFLDGDFKTASAFQEFFFTMPDGTSFPAGSSRQFHTKFESEKDWLEAVDQAYNDYNVLPQDRVQLGELPMITECLGSQCPSEVEWCETDPNCSESPYQEPDGSVKPGLLAVFVIAGTAIVIVALVFLHRRRMARQARRYRAKFTEGVARNISLRWSTKQLTTEALANEFDRIDSETPDGWISKDELWGFLAKEEAGELSRSDFEALFAAMDLDGNGKVDFMEFCAFLGHCHAEFEVAKKERRQRSLDRREKLMISASCISLPTETANDGGGEEEEGLVEIEA